jgi:hypothetical protein
MGAAKSIIDVNLAEPGEGLGKNRVSSFFPGMKAQVFQQKDIPILHRGHHFFNLRADAVRRGFDRLAQDFGKAFGHDDHPQPFHHFAVGPAEV